MKKIISAVLSAAITASMAVIPIQAADNTTKTETISFTYSAGDGKTYTREMEKLGRGLIAVKTDSGVFLSWRLLDSEDNRFGSADSNVSFNVYRGNEKIATVTKSTNYTDTTTGTSYSVAPVVDGTEGEKCDAVSVNDNYYFDITLDQPTAASLPKYVTENKWNYFVDSDGNKITSDDGWRDSSVAYGDVSYSINDCSCGDIDGDGEYEIIVKWDAGGQDNSYNGVTGNVYLDAYDFDRTTSTATKKWRIDLGKNIRAGAHYTQFLVYDFDGDGKAEVTAKTAPGSTDGTGNYVSQASHVDAIKNANVDSEDYRNSSGYILDGDEYLTIFNGETGAAEDTIYYPNQRIDVSVWGDAYGNRLDRFTSDVAYLDGTTPYAIYMRGYYFGSNGSQRQTACAVSFDGSQLECKYSFDTFDAVNAYSEYTSSSSYDSEGNYKGVNGYVSGNEIYVGNGNHNCTVADVDNDGRDEVITGATCYELDTDNKFGVKWCTFKQHGDALHIGDYDPTHAGFEFFTVHEDGGGTNSLSGTDVTLDYGMSVIDAATGEIIFHEAGSADTGRGVMANIGMGGYYQIWSSKNSLYMSNGGSLYTAGNKNGLSQNFRIFWDGDLYDNLLDGTNITDWNESSASMKTVLNASGCTQINGSKANPALQADLFGDWREEVVYPTTDNTKLRIYTTTDETEYKIKTLMQDPVYRSGVAAEQTAYNQPPHVGMYLNDELFGANVTEIKITSLPTKTSYAPSESFDRTGMTVTAYYDDGTYQNVESFTVSGYDSNKIGEQTLTVDFMGFTATFTVTVKEISSIEVTALPTNTTVYQGGTLNTSGLTVTVHYADGSSAVTTDYTLSDYDTSTVGTKTVTVSYMGKTASFDINVLEANIKALNGTYETNSTSSVCSTLPIGSYSGDFTIEHTLTVNSLPAAGSDQKNDTSGFFMRFMGEKNGTQTGGGYTFTNCSGTQFNLIWKYTKATSISTLEVGKTYTLKYDFTDVGSGSGASLTLTITDENGTQIAYVSGLNLRNFSDTDSGKQSPITFVEIYNQANADSSANIVISDAKVYGSGSIENVNGKAVTVKTSLSSLMNLFAANYNENGTLENIELLPLTSDGEITVNASFEPDKVFLWDKNMIPIDYYNVTAE